MFSSGSVAPGTEKEDQLAEMESIEKWIVPKTDCLSLVSPTDGEPFGIKITDQALERILQLQKIK